MKNLVKDEPREVRTIEDAEAKFQIWDVRIFGDRRDLELHAQSINGRLEAAEKKGKIIDELKARFNQALTWVLAAAFGALGLWLFNRLTMGS